MPNRSVYESPKKIPVAADMAHQSRDYSDNEKFSRKTYKRKVSVSPSIERSIKKQNPVTSLRDEKEIDTYPDYSLFSKDRQLEKIAPRTISALGSRKRSRNESPERRDEEKNNNQKKKLKKDSRYSDNGGRQNQTKKNDRFGTTTESLQENYRSIRQNKDSLPVMKDQKPYHPYRHQNFFGNSKSADYADSFLRKLQVPIHHTFSQKDEKLMRSQGLKKNEFDPRQNTRLNFSKMKRKGTSSDVRPNIQEECNKQLSIIEKLKRERKQIHTPCYNRALNLLRKANQLWQAEKLFEQIPEQERDIFTLTMMLKVYADQVKFAEAETLFKSIPERERDIVTLNTMLKVYAEQGKFAEAETLFKSIPERQRNIVTLNTMLKVYADQGKFAAAQTLFKSIPERQRNIVTLNTMLEVYADQSKFAEAETLFESIPEWKRNIVTLTTMLKVYAEQGKFAEAETLFKNIPERERNIVTLTTMLKVYAEQGKFAEAETLFKSIPERKRDIVTLNTMLKVYADQSKFAEAETLFKSIPERKRDIVTLNTMLKVYADQSKFAEAETLFESIPEWEQNIVTLTTMLKVYAEQGKFAEAETLFKSIPERKRNIVTLTTMLKVYAEQSKFAEAETLFKSIPERERNIVTLNTMLKVYAEQSKFAEAETLFKNIHERERDIVTLNTMLKVYAEQGKFAEAETLFKSIPERKRDIVTLTTMLKVYAEQSKFAEAETLFKSIPERKRDIVTLNTMLKVYAEQGKFAEAETLFKSIPERKRDIVTLTTMLKVYAEQVKFAEAETLFKSIPERERDIVTLNTMLKVYADQGKFAEAETLFKSIPERQRNIVTLNTMLKVYADQGKFAEAQTLFKSIPERERDIVTLTTMLKVYADQGKFAEAETLFKSIPERQRNIVTLNTMLKVYTDQGKFAEAETLFKSIPERERDIVTLNTMLGIFARQIKLEEFEHLLQDILSKQTTAVTLIVAMRGYLRLHQPEKSYELWQRHKQFHLPLQVKESSHVVSLALTVLAQLKTAESVAEGWEIADYLLKIDSQSASLKPELSDYLAITKLGMNTMSYQHLPHLFSLTKQIISALSEAKLTASYKSMRQKVAYNLQQLIEKARYLSKNNPEVQRFIQDTQDKVSLLLQEVVDEFKCSSFSSADTLYELSVLEGNLLNQYFPDLEITPTYKKLDEQAVATLQEKAYHQLPYYLNPLSPASAYTIDKVNRFGKKTGSSVLNDSIYQSIGAGQLGPYVIMDFNSPLKTSKIPLFIRYQGLIYRTDILGGSKWKTQISKKNYGHLIAVPLAAGDYFRHWFTSIESCVYGQRAFLPEAEDIINHGLKGSFRIGLIPDIQQVCLQMPFIVQDGWGYIKTSVYNKMGLAVLTEKSPAFASVLSYQALHSYEALDQKQAVLDLVKQGATSLQAVLQEWQGNRKAESKELGKLAAALSGGLPSAMAVAIPVTGKQLVLPDSRVWKEKAKDGLIVGRNPYDAKKLLAVNGSEAFSKEKADDLFRQYQVLEVEVKEFERKVGEALSAEDEKMLVELLTICAQLEDSVQRLIITVKNAQEIAFSESLAQLPAIQYTLTGYENKDGKITGRFFKGMLAPIDDSLWPQAYAVSDLLLSAKDQKLAQDWQNEEYKQQAQNSSKQQFFELAGMLVVKQQIAPGMLAGIPLSIAKSSAGDYDGDEYNLIPVQEFPAVHTMVRAAQATNRPNPKVPKIFTPTKQTGFFQKMIEFRLPLVEQWNSINNAVLALPENLRIQMAEAMRQDIVATLQHYLGNQGKNLVGIELLEQSAVSLLQVEIELSIKYSTDLPKTSAPVAKLEDRVRSYRVALQKHNKNLTVPYTKGLQRKLDEVAEKATVEEQKKAINTLMTNIVQSPAPKAPNVIGKSQRAIAMLFFKTFKEEKAITELTNSDLTGYISEDEIAHPTR